MSAVLPPLPTYASLMTCKPASPPAATVKSDTTAYIHHGLAIAKEALRADKDTCEEKSIQAGRAAYRGYVSAVEWLMTARASEEDVALKGNLKAHAKAYLKRAAVIKQWLDEARQSCNCGGGNDHCTCGPAACGPSATCAGACVACCLPICCCVPTACSTKKAPSTTKTLPPKPKATPAPAPPPAPPAPATPCCAPTCGPCEPVCMPGCGPGDYAYNQVVHKKNTDGKAFEEEYCYLNVFQGGAVADVGLHRRVPLAVLSV
eukprot:TRINITY_DN1985_c0_g1_i1.p3 TRINITY_DN1985_c0_g1~~TRINITY_DN1985_c0_g1_i1.p3  ORF type:complete len:261 (-),score=62.31 TRINITY_DN1985_c0_g1_i1:44-826(-)